MSSQSVWKAQIIRAHYERMGTFGKNHGVVRILPGWFPQVSDYTRLLWLSIPQSMRDAFGKDIDLANKFQKIRNHLISQGFQGLDITLTPNDYQALTAKFEACYKASYQP
jgi:hypothetical protein